MEQPITFDHFRESLPDLPPALLTTLWRHTKTFADLWCSSPTKEAAKKLIFVVARAIHRKGYRDAEVRTRQMLDVWVRQTNPSADVAQMDKLFRREWDSIAQHARQARQDYNRARRESRGATKLKATMLAAFRGQPCTISTLMTRTGATRDALDAQLRRCVGVELQRVSRGLYAPVGVVVPLPVPVVVPVPAPAAIKVERPQQPAAKPEPPRDEELYQLWSSMPPRVSWEHFLEMLDSAVTTVAHCRQLAAEHRAMKASNAPIDWSDIDAA